MELPKVYFTDVANVMVERLDMCSDVLEKIDVAKLSEKVVEAAASGSERGKLLLRLVARLIRGGDTPLQPDAVAYAKYYTAPVFLLILAVFCMLCLFPCSLCALPRQGCCW